MKLQALYRRLRYYAQYFPFTLNFFVVAAALWLSYYFLHRNNTKEQETVSSFRPLILLMGKVAFWFVAGLILFSIISTIACWLYYRVLKSKGGFSFSFVRETGKKGLVLESMVKKARRPFLGFIKGRLIYDGSSMTGKFLLAGNRRNKGKLWREAVTGRSILELPDVKEYAVKGGFIFFEDMLQLFSFAVHQPLGGHFYKTPDLLQGKDLEASPRKTDESEIRINQMRRVEGDYLNYKDFEHGDDVRRIVWKLYAKNRELVVRTPEIFNPYASHLYFYASFHSSLSSERNSNAFAAEMLNYYKHRVWTVYDVLAKKEFDIRYITDQETPGTESEQAAQKVMRIISNCNWQSDNELRTYFEPRFGSVLCISSMNEVEDVARALDACSADTVVYFIKLSDCFKSFAPLAWVLRIFMKPPADRLRRIRSRWILAPMRLQIIKREKAIEALLRNSEVINGEL